jgi:cardiolipin synthase
LEAEKNPALEKAHPRTTTNRSFPAPYHSWDGEKVYFKGDDYFKDVLSAIRRSKRQVDLEVYIYEKGVLGNRIGRELIRAARRGVKVRVLVDGIGSPDFDEDYGRRLEAGGVFFRVYRYFPTFLKMISKQLGFLRKEKSVHRFRQYWVHMNHRNHRKLFIVDRYEIWLGGFNVSDKELESASGKNAWRDTGLHLRGVRDHVFRLVFNSAWNDNVHRLHWRRYRRLLFQWLSRDSSASLIQVNATRRLRRRHHRELLGRLEEVRRRIWLTTPYFVPTFKMQRLLLRAARKGCDVRLLLPEKSDLPFVRLVSMAFYSPLLKAGCRIFEYQRSVLHAKTLLVDDWALVGSSNFNHRSFLFDLEVDVATKKPSSLKALERQYACDLRKSREMTAPDLKRRPIWVRIFMSVLFPLRFWC